MSNTDVAIPATQIPETGWNKHIVDTMLFDGNPITLSFYVKGEISVGERDAWVAYYTTQGIKPIPYSTQVRLANITPRIP